MGEGGIEPPTTRPPADSIQLNKFQLMYHTKLDHPPFEEWDFLIKDFL